MLRKQEANSNRLFQEFQKQNKQIEYLKTQRTYKTGQAPPARVTQKQLEVDNNLLMTEIGLLNNNVRNQTLGYQKNDSGRNIGSLKSALKFYSNMNSVMVEEQRTGSKSPNTLRR